MIQGRIDAKQKEIKPHNQILREVEDHLTVLEALQCPQQYVEYNLSQALLVTHIVRGGVAWVFS